MDAASRSRTLSIIWFGGTIVLKVNLPWTILISYAYEIYGMDPKNFSWKHIITHKNLITRWVSHGQKLF